MKCVWGLMIVMALGVWFAGLRTAGAQQPSNGSQPVRLQGVITDTMCGAKHMVSGDDAKCVRTCVKGGSHFALLVGEKVYELAGQNDELDKLAGKTVEVSGAVNADSAFRVASVRPVVVPASTAATKPSQDNTSPQTTTVEGLVRDIACPIQNPKAEARTFNLKCALDCVRLGSPIIILTDDGTIYMPISEAMPDHDQHPVLAPFVGKYVRVRGQVFERLGTRSIVLQNIEELKDVHLVTDAE
jgi:hypothetical protein